MRRIALLSAASVLAAAGALAMAAGPSLVRVADVPLPGRATRFDYQSLDPGTGILYLSHMGDGELLAFDTRSRSLCGRLEGFPRVTGVLAVPALHKIYCSVPGAGRVAVVSMGSFKELVELPADGFPDGLAYAPKQSRIFVSDEAGGREVMIDARTDRVLGRIAVGGEAGNTQYDPVSGHILVNVQTRGDMVELDPASGALLARHPLAGGRGPHGLLVDAAQRLAFVACEGDARLLVVDLRDFRVTQVLPTGADPDVLALDAGLGRVYVACEGDVLSVFSLHGRRLSKLEDAHPGQHCHTVCVDPASHLLYLPLEDVGGRPVLRIMRPTN